MRRSTSRDAHSEDGVDIACERLRDEEANTYKITKRIGGGATTDVFLVEDRDSRRAVAKVLKDEFAEDCYFRDLFQHEEYLSLRVEHPNWVRTIRSRLAPGAAMLVMEYIDGQTLEECIRDATRLDTRDALRVIRQVAVGLEFLHQLQDDDGSELFPVHRDVSTRNVMLMPNGFVKILDLGVASSTRTPYREGEEALRGTVAFMSPEQCQCRYVDQRSDIYSLGVVLFEALTGSLPYRGSSVEELLREIVQEPPPSVRDFGIADEALEAIVSKCVAKDPGMRFQSMGGVLRALHRYEIGMPPCTKETPLKEENSENVGDIPRILETHDVTYSQYQVDETKISWG